MQWLVRGLGLLGIALLICTILIVSILLDKSPAAIRRGLYTMKKVEAMSFGMSVDTPRGRITVLNDTGLEGFYGIAPLAGTDRGLKGQAVVFKVENLRECHRLLTERGVIFYKRDNRLLVPPAPGQGVLFVFGE